MKFVKGMVIGAMGAAGIAMMYMETTNKRKHIMKKGKQMAKKMGII